MWDTGIILDQLLAGRGSVPLPRIWKVVGVLYPPFQTSGNVFSKLNRKGLSWVILSIDGQQPGQPFKASDNQSYLEDWINVKPSILGTTEIITVDLRKQNRAFQNRIELK